MSTHAAGTRPFNLHDQSDQGWIERAEICLRLVAHAARAADRRLSLADLGCGDMKLGRMLADRGLEINYAGYDLLPQSPEVRRLDLTRDAVPAGADIAVMLGVGEYLPNLAHVLQRVGAASRWLIFSHVLRTDPPITEARLAKLGWVNHLGSEQLDTLLADAGLSIVLRRVTRNRRTVVLLCRGGA